MKKLLLILALTFPLFNFGQCVEGDCKNGFGTHLFQEEYTNSNGEITIYNYKYVGEWKNGKREGIGRLINLDLSNDRYYGEWKNDKRNGFGTETWVTTETGEIRGEYIGMFKDDKCFGNGTWMFLKTSIFTEDKDQYIVTGVWDGWDLVELIHTSPKK